VFPETGLPEMPILGNFEGIERGPESFGAPALTLSYSVHAELGGLLSFYPFSADVQTPKRSLSTPFTAAAWDAPQVGIRVSSCHEDG
jgi:hypothetical protein